ncbi:MAG: hypothetical protein WC989_05715 [Micavibrio sp.]
MTQGAVQEGTQRPPLEATAAAAAAVGRGRVPMVRRGAWKRYGRRLLTTQKPGQLAAAGAAVMLWSAAAVTVGCMAAAAGAREVTPLVMREALTQERAARGLSSLNMADHAAGRRQQGEHG